MISKKVYEYCCEDISKIENFEKAINDTVHNGHDRRPELPGFQKVVSFVFHFPLPAGDLTGCVRRVTVRISGPGSTLIPPTV